MKFWFNIIILLSILQFTSCKNDSDPIPVDEPAVLSIISFTPESGSDGTVVKITGTGFSTVSSENKVSFGSTTAVITAATATLLTVNLPPSLPYEQVKISVTRNETNVESEKNFITGMETLEGEISADRRLTTIKRYLLKGNVLVKNGVTLTVDPGVIIKGDKSSTGTLVIGRGAKINAEGTAENPIIFTSNQPKGFRNYGDWGGVILLGKATVNQGADQFIEGLPVESRFQYGGNTQNDNSGVMRYVRIEFCGVALTVGNEINGLTMGGVGSGTTIEHIQVSYSGDDSFEWFGGSVNCKYLISHRGFDDDFDTDLGYSGKVQFGLALRDPYVADASQSNGFESDNSSSNVGSPYTTGVFSNITYVGGAKLVRGTGTSDGVENDNFGRGAHLRRNTSLSIFNSVFLGSNYAGISIDGYEASLKYEDINGASEPDQIQLRGNVLSGTRTLIYPARGGIFSFEKSGFEGIGFAAPDEASSTFFATNNSLDVPMNTLGVDNLVAFSKLTNPDMLPSSSSILLNGSVFTGKAEDDFFDKVDFRGAFGTINWCESWTNFDPQQADY